MILENKKILLIAAKFFGYENDIKEELLSQGAQVDMIHDRPFNSATMKAVTKLAPRFMQFLVYIYYQLYFGYIFKNQYDYVFVIEGITLSKNALLKLKKSNPDARFILYVWDSVANRYHILNYKECYDQVFTFDPHDAKKYNVQFRPLFFTDTFKRNEDLPIKYDLDFIGTVHSDRYTIISKILKSLPRDCKKFIFLYFQAEWFYQLNRIFKKRYKDACKSDFKFKSISKKEVASTIASSLVTIDIEHPSQVGLTIRTFEVLGVRRKLATTNTSVKDYDFYDPQNIFILDRNHPSIPENFFRSPYKDLSPELYRRYSLRGWIEEIFNI